MSEPTRSERLQQALAVLGVHPDQPSGLDERRRAVLLAAALSGAAEREHLDAELELGQPADADLIDQSADEQAWDASGWEDDPLRVLTVLLRRADRLHRALRQVEAADPAYTTAAVAVALARHVLGYRQAAGLAEAVDEDEAADWHTRWHSEADDQLTVVPELLEQLRALVSRLTA